MWAASAGVLSLAMFLVVGQGSCEGPGALARGLDVEDADAEAAEGQPIDDDGDAGAIDAEVEALPPLPDMMSDLDLFVTLKTSRGAIHCGLFERRAPRTVANFKNLAQGQYFTSNPQTSEPEARAYYNGQIFHRVVPGLLIQAGDRSTTGMGGPGYTIEEEFHHELRHDRPGILSMANSGRHTTGGQFFITVTAAPEFDDRYSVFGICEDLGVINRISDETIDDRGRPLEDVKIKRVTFRRKRR